MSFVSSRLFGRALAKDQLGDDPECVEIPDEGGGAW